MTTLCKLFPWYSLFTLLDVWLKIYIAQVLMKFPKDIKSCNHGYNIMNIHKISELQCIQCINVRVRLTFKSWFRCWGSMCSAFPSFLSLASRPVGSCYCPQSSTFEGHLLKWQRDLAVAFWETLAKLPKSQPLLFPVGKNTDVEFLDCLFMSHFAFHGEMETSICTTSMLLQLKISEPPTYSPSPLSQIFKPPHLDHVLCSLLREEIKNTEMSETNKYMKLVY